MIVVMMGVSGVGKTTLGELLARKTGWQFHDADSFHSAANIDKMRNGIPLTDEDRWPWLDALNGVLQQAQARGESAILACSALKQRYRDRLSSGLRDVRLVYLTGDFDLVESRLHARKGHYMTAQLLQSQFAALEPPDGAIVLDVSAPPEALLQTIESHLA
jgi:gluconokinase